MGKTGGEVFLGGNFEGIKSKIDYFKRLGINAIYFTPIFKSTSSHRYNVDDYFDVDPAKEEFKELVETLHQNGIKVLHGFQSHRDRLFFQDVIKNGMDSKYFNWYNIKACQSIFRREIMRHLQLV
ncbi:alpha-amylase family glycosyl hydrolase [Caldicellulosiruptor naganoensis]|uniref:alpha-amylase family glycosyl hydrolase n=1 Tax=Caldicellulosiruptor naganoensis TaxID=29324 RepID=UPI001F30A967|nr:alpha-amylase family glycosyl hydrolase [Caldicellulosiruptor naganoensis]